ncbi:DNA-processing protein DprA [Wenyingzhuangia aestuarii]|uniref:DNA-processing protein DprA n=1 Tax=Wenyingzhuangia aestuarii TaxID=1647582 RepID=UPI00143B0880|nr:DNA-processing protein DprA [Wenyingzhuangia aestuarii]NJB81429.1 DNA processing protein [Wenyingzhuangia aestuarii]
MDIEELQYALALQDTKGVGSVTAKKLIAIYGSAVNLYQAHQNKEVKAGVNSAIFNKLFSKEAISKSSKEIDRALARGISCIYYKSESYPKHLLNCSDAPVILFKDGGENTNNFKRIISVVGTRNITAYGRDFCKELLVSLKGYNPLIVSGYAFGVDICAHIGALENDLSTLAVLAHGYGSVYPKEHKKYYRDVKESGGFLSEFTFEEPPYRENFLKRNRIVAGMSQATIVVESAAKGGALVTADIANSYNKDVFAVPGRTTDPYSKGCNNLIKQHKAALITSGEDLIEQLGWSSKIESSPKIVQPQLFVDVEGEEKTVYDMLEISSLYMDEISRISGIPIYKIANIVFQLEMKGLVQVLPGKMIKRV